MQSRPPFSTRLFRLLRARARAHATVSALIALAAALAILFAVAAPAGAYRFADPWPADESLGETHAIDVTFDSHSPFVLEDVGQGQKLDPATRIDAQLYLPKGAGPSNKVPAVILLHGSGGVIWSREPTYARQYAAMGVAALVVEVYGSRRHIATSYIERVLRITETMYVADAYAGLRYLAARPEIDGRRVAVIGFSYGGLAALLAGYEQVAERLAPGGERFAAHVSYYGSCLARFEDTRATGAPILLLSGSNDNVTDPERCAEVAGDLSRNGARVQAIEYQGAYHQWDGGIDGPYRRSRHLADCRFRVERDGTVRDTFTHIPMSNVFWRRAILILCASSEGYEQARNDRVRTLSNRAVGSFLSRAFATGAPDHTAH